MLRPKIPTMPTPTGLVSPPAVIEPTSIAPGAPVPTSTPVAPVSLLLAVAITGASVAVCAVVMRSLLAADAKRR